MKARLPVVLLSLLAITLLTAPLGAQALSADDVVALLKLGYSEAEIEKDVRASGAAVELGPRGVNALRKAGASSRLIAFIETFQRAGGGGIDAILALLREGKGVEEILGHILQAERRPALEPGDLAQLAAASAPAAVVMALRGQPLTLTDLEKLAASGLGERGFAALIDIVGAEKTALPPAKARALMRAGVPLEALTALREGRAARRQGAPPPPDPQPDVEPVLPTPEEHGGTFEHPAKMFTLRYPEEWSLLRDLYEGKVRFTLSPERGTQTVEAMQTLFAVVVDPLPADTSFADKGPDAILETLLPVIRFKEPKMEVLGSIAAARMGALSAARLVLQGTPHDKQGRYTCHVYMAPVDRMICSVVAMAPVEQFAAIEPTFARILKASSFGHQGFARQDSTTSADELVKKYKPAVVYVETQMPGMGNKGQGSGFIISKKGYVLTNWHVVWDMNRDQPGQKFTIHWDDSLKRPPVEAQLLGVQQREGRAGKTLGGIDVALLKIPPGDYTTVPLTPAWEAKLGDRILALGFPKAFDLTGMSMFATQGVLTRFNRSLDGNLESITHDAKITHGNSGGPCIDLNTGGVIGLNTWGQTEEDYKGYGFLCPIDAAIARFPLAAVANLDTEPGLDFLGAFEAARTFLALDGFKDAVKVAASAVQQRPDSADALALMGVCQEALGWDRLKDGDEKGHAKWIETAENAYKRALAVDPQHAGALVAMSNLLLAKQRLDEAARFAERGSQAHPDLWITATLSARVALERKQFDQALSHAQRAKANSREVLAEPFMVAGDAHYAQSQLEEGHREYEQAVRLHPTSMQAWFGEVGYFERGGRWQEAAAGYKRMLGKFPRHYLVLFRLGLCCLKMGREDDAGGHLIDAAALLKNAGQAGPPDLYMTLADLSAKKEQTVMAVQNYATFMDHYDHLPAVVDAHLKAAAIYAGEKILGPASAHHHLAQLYGEKHKRQVGKAAFGTKPLSSKDIIALIRYEYPFPIVELMILNNPVDLDVAGAAKAIAKRTGADLEKPEQLAQVLQMIAKELEVAPWIARAVFFSNLKYPPDRPPQNPFIGAWHTSGTINMVGPYQMWFRLFEDGTYHLKLVMAGYPHEEKDRYVIEGENITFGSGPGAKTRMVKVVDKDQIKVHFAEYSSWAFFQRASLTPPRWF